MKKYKEGQQKNKRLNLPLFLCPNTCRRVYGSNIENSIDVTQKPIQKLCSDSVDDYGEEEVM